ncbi:MAG: hypothetical protein JST16_07975 [Bdellovibrionales bacterium]|nr:hypothetical protein [Bdellovibrionales bacterium]
MRHILLEMSMAASFLGWVPGARAVLEDAASRDETPVLSSVNREPGGGDQELKADSNRSYGETHAGAVKGLGTIIPSAATPVWAVSAVGYYDATGTVQGTLRLGQIRYYGGIMASGEPVPQFQVLCDSAGHICSQPGYSSANYGVCFTNTHYE